jgi:hypothetical protein
MRENAAPEFFIGPVIALQAPSSGLPSAITSNNEYAHAGDFSQTRKGKA